MKLLPFLFAVGVMICVGCVLNFYNNPVLAIMGMVCGVTVMLRSWRGLL